MKKINLIDIKEKQINNDQLFGIDYIITKK